MCVYMYIFILSPFIKLLRRNKSVVQNAISMKSEKTFSITIEKIWFKKVLDGDLKLF